MNNSAVFALNPAAVEMTCRNDLQKQLLYTYRNNIIITLGRGNAVQAVAPEDCATTAAWKRFGSVNPARKRASLALFRSKGHVAAESSEMRTGSTHL